MFQKDNILKRINIIYIVAAVVLCFVYSVHYETVSMQTFSVMAAILIVIRAILDGKVEFHYPLIYLAQGLIIAAYIGRFVYGGMDTWNVMAPCVAYMIGYVTVGNSDGEKVDKQALAISLAMSTGLLLHGILGVFETRKNGLLGSEFAVNPFLKDVVEVPEIGFDFIMITALVVFAVAIFRKNKILSVALIIGVIVAQFFVYKLYGSIAGIGYIKSNGYRWPAFIQAIKLLFVQPKGSFTITEGGAFSSFNMWLDYGRDFGIGTFMLLFIFKILTLIQAFRLMIFDKTENKVKYMLGITYVAFNFFYSMESIAKGNIYFWLFGLMIAGMISAEITDKFRNKR